MLLYIAGQSQDNEIEVLLGKYLFHNLHDFSQMDPEKQKKD